MTYFGFLALFLILPLILMGILTWRDVRRGRSLPDALGGMPAWIAVTAHIAIALVYTTPWDNYLVATSVWWYDPALVTGITLGWVPLEEYCFFVLQTALTGLWLLFLARRLPVPAPFRPSRALRFAATTTLAVLWLAAVAILVLRWAPGTYLGLELAWALLPIGFQLLFGADILRHHWRLLVLTIVPATLLLAAADALAIGSGTWTIDPDQSTGLLIGGVLPVEELIFFLLTNVLVGFGITLFLSEESHGRAAALSRRLRGGRAADEQLSAGEGVR